MIQQVNVRDNKSLLELEIRSGDILGFCGVNIENGGYLSIIKASSGLSKDFNTTRGINLEFNRKDGTTERWSLKIYDKILNLRSAELGDPFVVWIPRIDLNIPSNQSARLSL